jgi:hypothetical protein
MNILIYHLFKFAFYWSSSRTCLPSWTAWPAHAGKSCTWFDVFNVKPKERVHQLVHHICDSDGPTLQGQTISQFGPVVDPSYNIPGKESEPSTPCLDFPPYGTVKSRGSTSYAVYATIWILTVSDVTWSIGRHTNRMQMKLHGKLWCIIIVAKKCFSDRLAHSRSFPKAWSRHHRVQVKLSTQTFKSILVQRQILIISPKYQTRKSSHSMMRSYVKLQPKNIYFDNPNRTWVLLRLEAMSEWYQTLLLYKNEETNNITPLGIIKRILLE